MITTDPNELVEPLHDRMPVILQPKDYDRWLTPGDPTHPVDLLRPFPAEQMKAWQVDRKVCNVKNDTPDCIEPMTPGQQASDRIPRRAIGLRRRGRQVNVLNSVADGAVRGLQDGDLAAAKRPGLPRPSAGTCSGTPIARCSANTAKMRRPCRSLRDTRRSQPRWRSTGMRAWRRSGRRKARS